MAEPERAHVAAGHDVIHLPPPSFWPVTMAIGLTLILTGLIINLVMTIVGAIIGIGSLVLWIRDARRELHELSEER